MVVGKISLRVKFHILIGTLCSTNCRIFCPRGTGGKHTCHNTFSWSLQQKSGYYLVLLSLICNGIGSWSPMTNSVTVITIWVAFCKIKIDASCLCPAKTLHPTKMFFNVGPTSAKLTHLWSNIGSMLDDNNVGHFKHCGSNSYLYFC